MATWSLAGRHAGPDKPPTPVLCSRQSPPQCAFLFSEEFTGDAAAFFQACADHQLEGIVSKLASSKYRSGRSKTWLKCKCFMESSLIIIGTEDAHYDPEILVSIRETSGAELLVIE